MSNVKKFFCENCSENDSLNFVQSSEVDSIEIKLIKQKSQGLISSYFYDFYKNLWSVKATNGVECECILDENAECYGNVVLTYKGESLKKYIAQSESIANVCNDAFDELYALYQENCKNDIIDDEIKNADMFDISMDVLAVA